MHAVQCGGDPEPNTPHPTNTCDTQNPTYAATGPGPAGGW